eukprot:scaffold7731_cov497-Prasinococcus_capsulatus_cf.AAC.1
MFGEYEYNPSYRYASTPIEEQLAALHTAIAKGKIRYIGLSNETAYGLMRFTALAKNLGPPPKIIGLQNAYSLLC